MPPTHNPLRLEAPILSRMRSPVTSRSNCAKDSSTFRVRRPMEVVVLNCWVTDTKLAPCRSRASTMRAKSARERVSRSTLDDDDIDAALGDIRQEVLQGRPVH